MFNRLDTIGDKLSMALYYTETSETNASHIDKSNVATEVLFGLIRPKTGQQLASIRIIVNEPIFSELHQDTYLTKDITVDEEGDCQFGVDYIQLSTYKQKEQGPLIFPHNGIIRCDFPLFTKVQSLHKDPDDPVYPFGTFSCLTDAVHALDEARDILASVENMSPVLTRAD